MRAFIDKAIRRDRDHQHIAQLPRGFQVLDMADVEEVEYPMTMDDLFSLRLKRGKRAGEIVYTFDFISSAFHCGQISKRAAELIRVHPSIGKMKECRNL